MDTDEHGLKRITPGNGFRGRSPRAGDMMGCGERRSPTLHVFNHGWTRINPDKEEGNGLRGRSPLAGDFRILNRLQAGDKTGVRPILKAHWHEQQPFNLLDPESAGKIISDSSLVGNSHCWERGCKRAGQSPKNFPTNKIFLPKIPRLGADGFHSSNSHRPARPGPAQPFSD